MNLISYELTHELAHAVLKNELIKKHDSLDLNIVINETNSILHELLLHENDNYYYLIGNYGYSAVYKLIMNKQIYDVLVKNKNITDKQKEKIINIRSDFEEYYNKIGIKIKVKRDLIDILHEFKNLESSYERGIYFISRMIALKIYNNLKEIDGYKKLYLNVLENSNKLSLDEYMNKLNLKLEELIK